MVRSRSWVLVAGEKLRTREILGNADICGAQWSSVASESKACSHSVPCPVDCVLTEWQVSQVLVAPSNVLRAASCPSLQGMLCFRPGASARQIALWEKLNAFGFPWRLRHTEAFLAAIYRCAGALKGCAIVFGRKETGR